ncbi:hypothetical protein PROQFM164_S05g000381 [Penicillium roqueforti FM164]|uniref:Cyanovirin-N domain-containing protein n=1 Tax=Penicillium roqueforti (strain FM164) TaxID=1365484 RepID=W6QIA1_PENRF|nr:hypothetical protein PROQFM164_S05g000381 [Penicillium roqueforti FM164]
MNTIMMRLGFLSSLFLNVVIARAGLSPVRTVCEFDWSLCQASNNGEMTCFCDSDKQNQSTIDLNDCFVNLDGDLSPRQNGGFMDSCGGISFMPALPTLRATCKPNNQITSINMGPDLKL